MAVLPVLAGLSGAYNMFASHRAAKKQRKSQTRQVRMYEQGLNAQRDQLGDIHRRQDLALGDNTIGLEGGVMRDRQANLDRDQKFDMDEIARRLAMAREGRRNLGALQSLENQQATAGILGNSAMALKALFPAKSPGLNATVGQMSGFGDNLTFNQAPPEDLILQLLKGNK